METKDFIAGSIMNLLWESKLGIFPIYIGEENLSAKFLLKFLKLATLDAMNGIEPSGPKSSKCQNSSESASDDTDIINWWPAYYYIVVVTLWGQSKYWYEIIESILNFKTFIELMDNKGILTTQHTSTYISINACTYEHTTQLLHHSYSRVNATCVCKWVVTICVLYVFQNDANTAHGFLFWKMKISNLSPKKWLSSEYFFFYLFSLTACFM